MAASGSLPPKTPLGRYRIEHLLGAGGMGDVYAARDTQLGRTVALKILSPDRSMDPSRVQRFIREAQLASSLNHPAIISVHDAGSAELESGATVHYLAMELVEGQTLDVWARSARDLRKVLDVLSAIADGLARAHTGGIVHRDLKPRNIIVGTDGHPRILDFGIAKLLERDDASNATDTAPAQAMGTAEYMSPEQVEGLAVDSRSDVFSFGALMYGALTGLSPFRRSTPVESMHAVMHDEPRPVSELRSSLPLELQRIVRKCLRKDCDERYQSIKDVAIDLREARDSNTVAAQRRRRMLWPTAAAVVVLAVIASVLLTITRASAPNALIAKTNGPQPVMMRLTNSGNIRAGAVTPDGNYLVYATADGENQTLWVKQIATSTNVRIIPPAPVYFTDISVSNDGNYVFYAMSTRAEPNINNIYQVPVLGGESRLVGRDMEGWFAVAPDGNRVAFLRFNAMERLYRIVVANIDGQSEETILSRPYPGMVGSMAWEPDGKAITFVGAVKENDKPVKPGLFRIDVATRAITPMPSPDWPGIGNLSWLRDGSGLVVTISEERQPRQIWFLPRDGTNARKITSDISRYGSVFVTSDSRNIIAQRSDVTANIWVVDLDGSPKPRPLTTGLGNCFGTGGVRWLPDGRIVYTVCGGTQALNVIDREGHTRELLRGHPYWHPSLSPDGRQLAVVSDRSGTDELWTFDLASGALAQVTRKGPFNYPSWAPDGKSLYCMSRGKDQLVWRAWMDGRTEKIIDRPANSPVVSPDGNRLLCRLRSTDPSTPLWRTAIIPLQPRGDPTFIDVPRSGGPPRPQWYRDSNAFTYLESVGGVPNIWVRDAKGGAPRQLTTFDSGEILYYDVTRDGRSIAISHAEFVNDIVQIRDFRTAASD
jgi:serine/threonine protein kinase